MPGCLASTIYGHWSNHKRKVDLTDAVGVLLRRAQAVGAVRPEVPAATGLSLVGGSRQAAAHMFMVSRPGLDPGTLGSEVRHLVSRRSARIHRPCSGEMSRPPSSAENNPVH